MNFERCVCTQTTRIICVLHFTRIISKALLLIRSGGDGDALLLVAAVVVVDDDDEHDNGT